ncbi:MAG: BMP family ABC transporter substrate-binding protein, partial [Clostridia bacterium]|nr:BMP family ABC transporter substrate-binding protein [Clostridia bacterium]
MKKILALILALVMVAALAACGGGGDTEPSNDSTPAPADVNYSVAMITDYGDITDQSFNQTTYEACKAFCDENGVNFKYFKPATDSDEDRVAMIESAIDEGFNVVVMPGYAFAKAIKSTA